MAAYPRPTSATAGPLALALALLLRLSGLMAQEQQYQILYQVTPAGTSINTTGSESAPLIINDTLLLFTRFHADRQEMSLFDFRGSTGMAAMQVFQASLDPEGNLRPSQLSDLPVNLKGIQTGNVAYDPLGDILYYTRTSSHGGQSTSHIYYSARKGGVWSKGRPLGGNINLKGHTSTHPAIAYQRGGKPILYFSSDRPGGQGGMDLWYAVILSEGVPGNCTNLGPAVNTDSNEVTPFYDPLDGILYFSSNRPGGQGGYDVYMAHGSRSQWQQPQSLGPQLNSPYNDLFFYRQPCNCACQHPHDSNLLDCGWMASNRRGSLFQTDSNCCNDIFRWRRLVGPPVADTGQAPSPADTAAPRPIALGMLPLSLYFHNDEPNPNCHDTVSPLDYSATWRRYMQLRPEYQGAQPQYADPRRQDSVRRLVDHFFDHQLAYGNSQLLHLIQLLATDLEQGRRVSITVRGYCSPLHAGTYNHRLAQRRISTIVNQIQRWYDGKLIKYIDSGRLVIRQEPYGLSAGQGLADTDALLNPADARSVYSQQAIYQRRIDIINYQYF